MESTCPPQLGRLRPGGGDGGRPTSPTPSETTGHVPPPPLPPEKLTLRPKAAARRPPGLSFPLCADSSCTPEPGPLPARPVSDTRNHRPESAAREVVRLRHFHTAGKAPEVAKQGPGPGRHTAPLGELWVLRGGRWHHLQHVPPGASRSQKPGRPYSQCQVPAPCVRSTPAPVAFSWAQEGPRGGGPWRPGTQLRTGGACDKDLNLPLLPQTPSQSNFSCWAMREGCGQRRKGGWREEGASAMPQHGHQ